MSNLVQRTLSGTIYAGLVVASIVVHPIFFAVLFCIVSMLAVREFHNLIQSTRFQTIVAILGSGLLFTLMYVRGHCDMFYVRVFAILYGLCLIVGLVAELFLKQEHPIHNWGTFLSSQVMIALPFALMNGILVVNKYILLALFITIWVNDSGAYCVGSLTAKRRNGNHKMFPRISPAKSWEGLIGGVFFALLAGYVYYCVGWLDNLVFALCFSFLVAVAGTLGDLMESLMKRTIGVKDSGRFMPGHGGVLDRFDSILLATPVIYLLLTIL